MQSKHQALLERTRISDSELYPAALRTAEAEGKAAIPRLTEVIATMQSCTPIDLPGNIARASSSQLLKKPPIITNQSD